MSAKTSKHLENALSTIPEPYNPEIEFQIPKSLHKKLIEKANQDGISFHLLTTWVLIQAAKNNND